jgi:hypothetical protein
LGDALAFRRSTAALAKSLAAFSSVRSRASWSRTTDPRPGQPAPGRPATWPAGRVSEPPADGVTSPIPGTAPAPSIGRHRLTSLRTSEMGSFSGSRNQRQEISPMHDIALIRRRFSSVPGSLFWRRNCDRWLDSLFFPLTGGARGHFRIVAVERPPSPPDECPLSGESGRQSNVL